MLVVSFQQEEGLFVLRNNRALS